jgi:opacity protein-like surface antigen
MRILLIITVLLGIIISSVNAQKQPVKKKQISLYAGMGLDYGITPEFNDYLVAEIPYSTSDSIKSFNAGIEFFGGLEYEFSSTISAKLDYSYYIRSMSYSYSPAVFDYNKRPSAVYNC